MNVNTLPLVMTFFPLLCFVSLNLWAAIINDTLQRFLY